MTMRTRSGRVVAGRWLVIASALWLAALPIGGAAQQAADADSPVVVYEPPLRGAPSTRVSGGVRGGPADAVHVLAPDHTGLVSLEQPVLYWYSGAAVNADVVFTLANADTQEAAVEAALPSPASAGVHAVSLQSLNVHLPPGVEYEWFVTAVQGEQPSSLDVVSGGTIERRDLPPDVRAEAKAAGEAGAFAVYARAGWWYDAVASLSVAIAARPEHAGLREARATLMEQAGLGTVAGYDRARVE